MAAVPLKIVVFDDDPTGSQTLHSCPLLLRWDASNLRAGLAHPSPFLFLLANTRALAPAAAAARVGQICRALAPALAAARREGLIGRWLLVSRGDSTLRSHFPLECEVIAAELGGGRRASAGHRCHAAGAGLPAGGPHHRERRPSAAGGAGAHHRLRPRPAAGLPQQLPARLGGGEERRADPGGQRGAHRPGRAGCGRRRSAEGHSALCARLAALEGNRLRGGGCGAAPAAGGPGGRGAGAHGASRRAALGPAAAVPVPGAASLLNALAPARPPAPRCRRPWPPCAAGTPRGCRCRAWCWWAPMCPWPMPSWRSC